MPVIREYQQRTQAADPTQGSPFANTPSTSGAEAEGMAFRELAGGLEQGANVLNARNEEQARAWAAPVLSDARVKWTQEFLDRQGTADPGAPDFTPNLLKDYDEYATQTVASAPTLHAKTFLNMRLQAFRSQLANKSLEYEAQARIDYRNDQFNAGIDNSAKLMNTDPTQFDDALAEQRAIISSSSMPQKQKSALLESANNKIAMSAVWSQIQRSPSNFLQSIGFGVPVDDKARKTSDVLAGRTGNNAFDLLPADKRQFMLGQALTLKNQIDTDVDRKSKIVQQQLDDDAFKNILSDWQDGKLQRNTIENYRSVLTPARYESALKMLGEAPQKTDQGAYRQVQQLMANGNYAGAEQLALKFHQNGLFSNSDLGSTVERSRSLMRQEGPKSDYERGHGYIVTAMDPGPTVKDPEGRQRLADAVRDFDTWYGPDGKGKTSADVDAYATDAVRRWKIVEMHDKSIGLPLPRSGNIDRTIGPQTKAQIAAAMTEAIKRRDNGTYSPSEYAAEVSILNNWRKLSDAYIPPAPPKAKK